MKKTALTDITLRKLKPPEKGQREIWDSKIAGFGIRLSGSGTKSFILMYRFKNKLRRKTIGRYPDLSLAEARQLAQDLLNKVAHGVDPRPETVIEKKRYNFEQAVKDFLALHCARHNKPITQRDTARILKNRFTSKWRERDIREINKTDVLKVLDSIIAAGMPSAANHAFSAIRKFFNWCVERDLVNFSPCTGIKKPAKDHSKDRVLDDAELKVIWCAAGEMNIPFGKIVQLLMLTGQRRNEVATMRWSHLDLEQNIWTIPPEFTKNNQQHSLPLTSAVLKVMNNLPHFNSDFVFPSQGEKYPAYNNFSGGKRSFDKMTELSPWTLHDLRRSTATHLARLETSPHVVEKILNHSSGTFGGVAGIYNRFAYMPEMREALEKWGNHILSLQDDV